MRRILIVLTVLAFAQRCTVRKQIVQKDAELSVRQFLTYNVLTGFQRNLQQAERFINWAAGKDFDVIAFQELSSFTQDSLQRFARRYGHNYAVLNKGNGSPVGITSRFPIAKYELITGNMHHGCVYAETGGVHFFITHLNPFSYEKCVEEMKGILLKAAAIPETEKIVIAGDLNSFSPADSLHYAQKRKYGVIQSLLDNGYTDVFRNFHQEFQHSFPTVAYSYKVKSPTRIDFVFAGKMALNYLTAAEIIRDSVTDVLSDHYPLMVTFRN